MYPLDINLFYKLYHYPEGEYIDFKSKLYFSERNNDEEKDKFVKDMIAFANMTRRTGKPSYIVFGVDDITNEIQGIGNPKGNDKQQNPCYLEKEYDTYENRLTSISKEWIDPISPDFNFYVGDFQNKRVAFIKIDFRRTSEPFSYKKDFNGKKGKVYLRVNSNTIEIPKSEISNLLSADRVAYLSKEDWKNCLTQYVQDEFWDSININPNFLLSTEEGESLDQAVDKLLADHKRIVIIANAGLGKSTFVKQLTYRYADKILKSDISKKIEYGIFDPPTSFSDNNLFNTLDLEVCPSSKIPLYLNLKSKISNLHDLESQIINSFFRDFERDKPTNLNNLFSISSSEWVLLLDGLDELKDKQVSGIVLEQFIINLPKNVKVIITSRPYALGYLENFKVIRIKPLEIEKIKKFIKHKIELHYQYGDLVKKEKRILYKKIKRQIIKNNEFCQLLSSFRTIEGLLNEYFPQPQIPSQENSLPSNSNHQINPHMLLISQPNKESITGNEDQDPNLPIAMINNDDTYSNIQIKKYPESEDQLNSKNNWSLPVLTQLLDGITEYMKNVEIKRQSCLGYNAEKEINKAFRKLGYTAYYCNWNFEKIELDSILYNEWIDEEDIEWSEYVGFISKIDVKFFIFQSNLIRKFLTAKFAFNTKNLEKFQIEPETNYKQDVITFIRQICSKKGVENLI